MRRRPNHTRLRRSIKPRLGDIVTGKDTSYKRSLYKVIKIVDEHTFDLLFMCLNGQMGRPTDISTGRQIKDFRIASSKQIYEDLGLAHKYQFYRFMIKVLSIKRSGLARQSFDSLDHQL